MDFPTTVLPLPVDDRFANQPNLQRAYERLRAYEACHSATGGDSLPAR